MTLSPTLNFQFISIFSFHVSLSINFHSIILLLLIVFIIHILSLHSIFSCAPSSHIHIIHHIHHLIPIIQIDKSKNLSGSELKYCLKLSISNITLSLTLSFSNSVL
ncbi:hypothetical protein HOF65_04980 [bacterium]|nr:hypothetical protein [bacterium]